MGLERSQASPKALHIQPQGRFRLEVDIPPYPPPIKEDYVAVGERNNEYK